MNYADNQVNMINMMNVALQTLEQNLEANNKDNAKEKIKGFHFVRCDDQIVAKIKIINNNDKLRVTFSSRISTRTDNGSDAMERIPIVGAKSDGTLKRIVLVLESPHKSEYEIAGAQKKAIGPAYGTTGRNINTYFPQLLERAISDGIIVIKEEQFELVLMNAIQFQCSLEQQPSKFRDAVFLLSWKQTACVDNFVDRLKDICNIPQECIVINCCTKGSYAEKIARAEGYLTNKILKDLDVRIRGTTTYVLKELVDSAIERAVGCVAIVSYTPVSTPRVGLCLKSSKSYVSVKANSVRNEQFKPYAVCFDAYTIAPVALKMLGLT